MVVHFWLLICGLLALGGSGCASVGVPLARSGEWLGNAGTATMVGAIPSVVFIPVGFAVGLPAFVLGVPLYYGGCALSGQACGPYPSGF